MQEGMHVVTLGTAGGPLIRRNISNGHHSGIATAIVVDSTCYLVDCGHGTAHGLAQAGLTVRDLGAVFITHHHSDHVIDLNSVMVLGGLALRGMEDRRIPIIGPGDRAVLPPVSYDGPTPEAIFPDEPTVGTRRLVELLLRAHVTDLNDRRRDSRAPDLSQIFEGSDIALPDELSFHPDDNSHPAMEPLIVYKDDKVTVTATLVDHRPLAPAYAYRIDSAYGSVTVSGDTAPSDNLVTLAQGSDLLLHEAIDLEAVAKSYPNATPTELEASMGHHRRAHTTPEDAGRIAQRANVAALALHHLVPASSPPEVWQRARKTYDGTLLIPQDHAVITVRRGAAQLAESCYATAT